MKVKELIKYEEKSKIKAGEAVENGKYPFFTSSEAEDKRYNDYTCDTEGIIMGTGGNATLHYCNGRFAVSTDCLVLKTNDKVNCKYLFYFFKANMNILQAGFKGAGLKHTNKNYIENIEMNRLPDINQQKHIVYLIDKVETLVKKHNNIINYLDTLIKARFVEMFGDPILNCKKWDKREISDVVDKDCTISYGIVQTGDEQESGIPVFRPIDVVNKVDNITELKKTTKEISNRYKKTLLKGNEILITVRANIGDTYIVPVKFSGCNVGRGITPLNFNNKIINNVFMKAQFENNEMKQFIKGLAKGITLLQLNMEDLRTLSIIVPPIELQNQFATFVKQVDKLKVA